MLFEQLQVGKIYVWAHPEDCKCKAFVPGTSYVLRCISISKWTASSFECVTTKEKIHLKQRQVYLELHEIDPALVCMKYPGVEQFLEV